MFAGFRNIFSLANFPAAVAAGLVLCIGLGFLLVNYLGGGKQEVAANFNLTAVETATRPAVLPAAEITKQEVAVETAKPYKPADRQIKPVRAVQYRRPRIEKQTTARNSADQNPIPTISNAPALSENYEEADDGSLRLSDLFADDDG